MAETIRDLLFAAIRGGVCAVNAQSHPVVFTSDMPMIMDELIGQEKDSTND